MTETKNQTIFPQSNQPKNISLKNKFLNLKRLNQFFLTLIIILGVYYLYGINNILIKGFELKDLKDQGSQLTTENQNLELNVMSLSSYNNISQRVKSLKMVAVGQVDYIMSGLGIVAKK